MSDDEPAIERARRGDESAFRSLYEEHQRRVYALSLRLTGNRAEAEELMQDVFVAAWRQLPRYRGTGRFSTWLHGIAVRLSRQRWRAFLRRRRREQTFACGSYADAVKASMPEANLALERAVAALPERMRAALVLHVIEGYSQAETAEMMGISEGTVKAHVHRARTLLRERMEAGPWTRSTSG